MSKIRLRRAGRKSIARRLALLHIGAVLISYTLFAGLFYARRIDQRHKVEARELTDEVVSIKTMMRQPNGRELLGFEMTAQRYEPDGSRMYIRLLDRRGATLQETPGMTDAIPATAFRSLSAGPGRCLSNWQSSGGDYFLLMSSELPDSLVSGRGCTLQLATSAKDDILYRSQLRWALFLFIGCGAVFAFVCAYFIVRIGLKPLEEISRTAGSITRRELHTRIDPSDFPKELLPLVQSFNSMLARLEDSFGRLSHYSANLAHELRTPINTLLIAAEIALARERGPEEYRAVLASSLEELGRMTVTIERMLFLARADLEQPGLVLQRVEVAAVVEDLFDYYSEAAGDAGIVLERSGDATVWADETLLRRALCNLISNSLAYTPSGGAIAVSCSGEGAGAEVAVRDNGAGIDAADLPKVCDRFYRAAGSGGSSPDGSGLGLAIVKAIMQMHGGTVAIKSKPGAGTEVILHFPPPAAPSNTP